MAGLADRRISEALAALGSPADPPAAGVAAALSCAVAASLVELAAGLAAKRLSEDQEHLDPDGAARMRSLSTRALELRARLLQAADEDTDAYAEVARADDAEGRATALAAAADPPLVIAECAAEVAEAAAETAARARDWAFGADAAVAAELSSGGRARRRPTGRSQPRLRAPTTRGRRAPVRPSTGPPAPSAPPKARLATCRGHPSSM